MTGKRGTARGGGRGTRRRGLVVECDRCAIRGVGCGDCAIGAIIGESRPGESRPRVTHNGAELSGEDWRALSGEDRRALGVLASEGLGPELLDAPAGGISPQGGLQGPSGLPVRDGLAAAHGLGLRPHARAS